MGVDHALCQSVGNNVKTGRIKIESKDDRRNVVFCHPPPITGKEDVAVGIGLGCQVPSLHFLLGPKETMAVLQEEWLGGRAIGHTVWDEDLREGGREGGRGERGNVRTREGVVRTRVGGSREERERRSRVGR